MLKNKVFILVPNNNRIGGIANYYRVLKKYLNKHVEYISRGGKEKNESKVFIPFRLLFDYIYFCYKAWFQRTTILINTSLGKKGILRDGIYFMLTPFNSKKIAFFRGWNPAFEKKINESFFLKIWMRTTFLKADQIIVLSSSFKQKLREWGYKETINVETTVVDEDLFWGETWQSICSYREQLGQSNILYLGNIIKPKGVWEITKALKILHDKNLFNEFTTTIAGKGEERDALKKFTINNNIPVYFPGYVRNKQKADIFKKATIFIFASYHEGMPNAVLEAMAYGLVVLTTPVGGLPDFFEEGKMGFYLKERDPEYIARKINYLFKRPDLIKTISAYNFNYAQEHFYAEKVAKRLKKILR